jgi:hypothetical protein
LKNLKLVFILLTISCNLNSQTLHAIIVSDQKDFKISPTCIASETKMFQTVSFISEKLKYTLNPIYLKNETFNQQSLIKAIRSLHVQESDIIITYFVGKSFFRRKQKSEFPHLLFERKNYVSMTIVGEELIAKKAHLSMLILDSQNTVFDIEIPSGPFVDGLTTVGPDLSEIISKKIFLGSCGHIKIASGIKKGSINLERQSGKPQNSHFSEEFSNEIKEITRMMKIPKEQNLTIDYLFENVEIKMRYGNKTSITEPLLLIKRENCTQNALERAEKINNFKYPESMVELDARLQEILKEQSKQKRDYLFDKISEGIDKYAQFNGLINYPDGQKVKFHNFSNQFISFLKLNADKISVLEFSDKSRVFELPIGNPFDKKNTVIKFNMSLSE